jgi:uncharacterized RDD family membrane protein YckC
MALPPVPAPLAYSPAPADVAGVLAGRIGAFLVDFVVIGVLVLVFSAVVMVLGVFTFGLAWLLMPALVPLVALVYNGITVSGPRRGTWGMRTFGIEMRMAESGGPVPFVVIVPPVASNVPLQLPARSSAGSTNSSRLRM